MFKTVVGCTAIGVSVITSSVFAPAVAQDVDSLTQRIEELTAEWTQLYRLANEIDSVQAIADSIQRTNHRLDSIRVGSLLVTIDRAAQALIEPTVRQLWQQLQPLGSAYLISETPFRVDVTRMRVREETSFVYLSQTRVTISTDRIGGIAAETADHPAEISQVVETALRKAIDLHMANLAPSEVVAWAGRVGPWPEKSDMRRSYLDLIANPTTTARACWNRDYVACHIALGLQPSEDPLRDWFNDRDRRELVAATMSWYQPAPRTIRDLRDSCLTGSAPEACETLLRQQDYRSAPLAQLHRTEVMLTAMRMGGPESFARLVHSSGSIVERLERTAGTSVDRVLERWLDDMEAAVGTPVRVTYRTGLTTLLWTLVFMFAATRSTRWRSS